MAVSSCDDLSLTAESSLDLMYKREQVQCKLACVFCDVAAAAATQHLKVLPCLHVACEQCLTQFLSDISPSHKDANFAASIFSCPRCSYTVQLPSAGVDGLTDAVFLQSRAAESRAAWRSEDSRPSSTSVSASSHLNNSSSLSASLSETNHSEAVKPLLNYAESSSYTVETLEAGAVNSESRDDSAACSVGRTLDDELSHETTAVTRSQICSLSQDALSCQRHCEHVIEQTKRAAHDLDARKTALRSSICERADHLCSVIRARCNELLSELDREHSRSSAECSERLDVLRAHSACLTESREFADAVLSADDDDVSVQLAADVTARLRQLLLSDTHAVDVTVMRLDVPDSQHDESHVDKLCGSLIKGTVRSVHCVTSFHTDLQWPAGFVVTRGRGSVLAGKTGAFSEEGHVLFYDCHGACVHRHTLAAGHLPVDVVTVAGADVLISDIAGCIAKFSSSGRLVAEWTDMFQGPSGHMAVNSCHQVLVTSAGECCVHRYHETTGERLATISLHWPDSTAPDVTAMSVNSHDEIVVTASNVRSPCFFTADGRLLHSCSVQAAAAAVDGVERHVENGVNVSSVALPSAVCCDTFDNVLVADFLGNCVHLMSRRGQHLGRLLTKAHGIACPNFIALDQDGRLYVGQYGGDVLVFNYLSYVKHV